MGTITSRYLNKEVLTAMLAFTVVLLIIIITGRLSKYLAGAAQGVVNPNILFWLIWYRLPDFLQLILPMSLFLGILLGFGRLYVDNEMTVLLACGVSVRQIGMKLIAGVLLVTVVVAALSLWIAPQSNSKMNLLWSSQDSSAMKFASMVPGRFQPQADKTRVAYTETLSSDKQQLGNVFIAQVNKQNKKAATKNDRNETLMVIVAESATQKIKSETGDRFIILNNGYRYDGRPGQLDYRAMKFSSYGVKIVDAEDDNVLKKQDEKTTYDLWRSTRVEDSASLQWRLSLPLLVPIVALLAIALSRVRPRQGRFVKLVPAFCIYLLYVLLLVGMRSAIASYNLPLIMGMMWVHALFLILALLLFKEDQLAYYWHQLRSPSADKR
jgi:lipopolysaccharide export system permease protein